MIAKKVKKSCNFLDFRSDPDPDQNETDQKHCAINGTLVKNNNMVDKLTACLDWWYICVTAIVAEYAPQSEARRPRGP